MLNGSGFVVPVSDSGNAGTLEEWDDVGSFDACEKLITTSLSLLVLLSAIYKLPPSSDTCAMRFDINGYMKSPKARPNPKNTKVESSNV